MSIFMRLLGSLMVGALACTVTLLGPALPASAVAKTTPTPTGVGEDTITVETFLSDNKTLVSTQTFGVETQGLTSEATASDAGFSTQASGSGGSTSASGCRRVTVNNEGVSPNLGTTVFWFRTWTRWCWTRSTQTVYDVSSGWTIDDVAPFTYWRGINNKELGFYDYSTNDGHPRSAYKNYRQGSFENCPLKIGCVGMRYPSNTLRSYYNGTWAWNTTE